MSPLARREHRVRRVQRRLERRLVVAVVAVLAGAGDRGDDLRSARSTRRMRSLCESATIRSPSGAIATPSGVSSCARVAGPVVAGEAAGRRCRRRSTTFDAGRTGRSRRCSNRRSRCRRSRLDGDAARRVEAGRNRRPVVPPLPFRPPITSATFAASRSMNVPAPMPTIMTTKMDGAAQAVGADQGRRDQRHARRTRAHHASSCRRGRPGRSPRRDDRRRLRGAPDARTR